MQGETDSAKCNGVADLGRGADADRSDHAVFLTDARRVIELLAHVFADARHLATAGALGVRGLVMPIHARQMGRQSRALR